MTPPRSPRQQQKKRTRQRIIEEARGLFLANGFERTTMREIGAAAGTTAGNLFVHFPDKVALLVATLATPAAEELIPASRTSGPSRSGYCPRLQSGSL